MALVSEYGGNVLAPEGLSHRAVVISFVDLGEQDGNFGPSRQGQLSFELMDEKTEDGKVILVHKRVFNLKSSNRKWREILRSITGLYDISRVDTKELIGKECCLSIEHKTNDNGTFADTEIKPMRGKPSGYKPMSDTTFVSLHPDELDEGAINDLPEWQADKIRKSVTYKELIADLTLAKKGGKAGGMQPKDKPASDIMDDDLPENLGGAPKKDAA